MSIELKPCPFCGGSDFEIVENGRIWSGMKYSEPVSVGVRHWCPATPGQPSRMIERVGRDEASAVTAWSTRHTLSQQPAIPEGWVPCIVTYEGQHPEEVAYGPQRMMERLKKWLDRYFEMKVVQQPATGEPVAYLYRCRKKPELKQLRFNARCAGLESLGYKARPLVFGDTTPPASQEQADAATSAGTQAAIGHLSRLVDEATSLISQLRTMVDDMHEQWSIGGVPERGEFPLLDRVDDWLSARPSQEQAQQTKCACGDRPVEQCDEEWGPNCDLGNNEKYVRVAHQPSVTVRYDLSPAMVEGAIRDRLIAMGWTPPLQQPKPQPMTEDKAKELADAANFTYLGIDGNLYPSNREGEIQTDEVLAYCRAIEAHHGINAQAKKETP